VSNSFAFVERFPRPEFQSDYVLPKTTTPNPRSTVLEYVDVLVLIGALGLASYVTLKKRSRNHTFILMIFSLVYFGFWRKGCVCPIGAIQNVTLALFNSTYVIPLVVIAFFVIPLIFTLFFGRTFCAAVCPLGAIQDFVLIRPTKVPAWLSNVLGIFPYVYLGLAIFFAATGAGFIICRYDPFVGFFRFGLNFDMLILGSSFLILGTIVGRPYCQFLCPYGVFLNWMSQLSKRHVTITPNECIQCRLCEESCPFGAIQKPTEAHYPETRSQGVRRLAILFALLPLMLVCGGFVGSRLYIPFSRQHVTVDLAEQIRLEDIGVYGDTTEETRTFRATGKPTEELHSEAIAIQNRFKKGGWILGGFIGLVFGLKLVNLSIRRKRVDYEVDKGTCFSCARCFSYCPQERILEQLKGVMT
jgi:NosR/NirI family nitrous oxide reductase transcriptional regulator